MLVHCKEGMEFCTRCFLPIQYAAFSGRVQMVEKFIAAGSPLDHHVRAPLEFAAQQSQWEIIKLLIDKGADPNYKSSGDSPLHAASKAGQLDLVKQLIEAGAEINDLSYKGHDDSPLTYAIKNGHLDVVKYLIEQGADVRWKSICGTILECAREAGQDDIVAYLETL